VHDPNNDALRAVIQHQIARSITRWEPRVLLQSVAVSQQGGSLNAELRYIIRSSQQAQTLSVPLGVGGL
jgi:phage baseplate assembly protein W